MLREQVISSWNSYKEKLISFKKAVEFTSERFLDLPSYPVGYETARRNLDFWTSANFLMNLDQGKKELTELMNTTDLTISNEILGILSLAYYNSISMFTELTQGWKREIDNNNSGPTIEEVDD